MKAQVVARRAVHPLTSSVLPIVRHVTGGGVLDQLAGAVDVERVAAGAGGRAQVDRAAGDQDGRLGIAGRLLDRAVADDQAAAVDHDRRGIGGGLGGDALEDDRSAIDDDRWRVPGNDRPVGEGDGSAVDNEVAGAVALPWTVTLPPLTVHSTARRWRRRRRSRR